MDNTYALNKVHASFEGGEGGGGELFASKGWNLGVFLCRAAWACWLVYNIHYLFFVLPLLPFTLPYLHVPC